MTRPDYYQILGVGRDADDREIKRAFHRQALRWHPDRNADNPEAERHFRDAAEAYQVLGDPGKRARYDSGRDPAGGDERLAGRGFAGGGLGRRGRGCGRGRGRGCGRRFVGNDWPGGIPRSSPGRIIEVTVDRGEAVQGCSRTISIESVFGRAELDLRLPPGLAHGDVLRVDGIPDGGRELLVRVHVTG